MHPTGWETIEYASIAISDPRAEAFARTLQRAHSNGRIILCRLIPTDGDAFDWASRYDRRGLDHLLGTFLLAASSSPALTDIGIAGCDKLPPDYRAISAFEFEGALIHALVMGGAYGAAVPEDAARQLSREFVDSCFDTRWLGATVFVIPGAWTNWFYDIAWDRTFVAYDPDGKAWTCLFVTDTD